MEIDTSEATEKVLREALGEAVAALERIRDSDPGPAYYIAKASLERVAEMLGVEGGCRGE